MSGHVNVNQTAVHSACFYTFALIYVYLRPDTRHILIPGVNGAKREEEILFSFSLCWFPNVTEMVYKSNFGKMLERRFQNKSNSLGYICCIDRLYCQTNLFQLVKRLQGHHKTLLNRVVKKQNHNKQPIMCLQTCMMGEVFSHVTLQANHYPREYPQNDICDIIHLVHKPEKCN